MQKLSNIGVIKDILRRHNFNFSKGLGQNFLVNPSVCPKMAEMSGSRGIGVIEIGAGIGILTTELALIAKKVVCIEIDSRLFPVLKETLSEFDNITLINADILKVDLHQIIHDNFEGMDVVICANLPYYITSPIIMKILEEKVPIKALTVMVQKEAATRICANVSSREAGAITAAIHYHSSPSLLFNVSRGSFMPSPDVDSAVIRLNILPYAPVNMMDEKLFFHVVKAAFSQRRKTAVNPLSGEFSISKDELKEFFNKIGVPPSARAENLTLQNFADISDYIYLKNCN